jgi:hypothetical protein
MRRRWPVLHRIPSPAGQGVGDLTAVGVGPLAGSSTTTCPAPRRSAASLGLEVGVLLGRDAVLGLHGHVCGGKSRRDVALADLVVHTDIAVAELRVEQGRAGLHAFLGVEDRRQILALDLDQGAGLGGSLFGLGDDGRQLVADEADEEVHPASTPPALPGEVGGAGRTKRAGR